MGGERTTKAPPCRAWLGLLIGLLFIALLRLRSEIPGYAALHRWLLEQGVPPHVRNLDGALLLLIGAWLGARLAIGQGSVLAALGLCRSPVRGLVFGVVAGIPMVAQAALAHPLLPWSPTWLRGTIAQPLAEEVFFRGLFVVMPVMCGRWPFWPCAIVGGLVFGSLHVEWSTAFGGNDALILAVTTVGGVWFAWLCRAFAWNLWTTIVLHGVMNAAWSVFGVADDAAGGFWPNVGRGLTIALGTVLAIRQQRLGAAAR